MESGWGEVTELYHLEFRKNVLGPVPHIPPPPLCINLPSSPAWPHTRWCYIIESLQSQGLNFPGGAAQKNMEIWGMGRLCKGVAIPQLLQLLHVCFYNCSMYLGSSKILLEEIF